MHGCGYAGLYPGVSIARVMSIHSVALLGYLKGWERLGAIQEQIFPIGGGKKICCCCVVLICFGKICS